MSDKAVYNMEFCIPDIKAGSQNVYPLPFDIKAQSAFWCNGNDVWVKIKTELIALMDTELFMNFCHRFADLGVLSRFLNSFFHEGKKDKGDPLWADNIRNGQIALSFYSWFDLEGGALKLRRFIESRLAKNKFEKQDLDPERWSNELVPVVAHAVIRDAIKKKHDLPHLTQWLVALTKRVLSGEIDVYIEHNLRHLIAAVGKLCGLSDKPGFPSWEAIERRVKSDNELQSTAGVLLAALHLRDFGFRCRQERFKENVIGNYFPLPSSLAIRSYDLMDKLDEERSNLKKLEVWHLLILGSVYLVDPQRVTSKWFALPWCNGQNCSLKDAVKKALIERLLSHPTTRRFFFNFAPDILSDLYPFYRRSIPISDSCYWKLSRALFNNDFPKVTTLSRKERRYRKSAYLRLRMHLAKRVTFMYLQSTVLMPYIKRYEPELLNTKDGWQKVLHHLKSQELDLFKSALGLWLLFSPHTTEKAAYLVDIFKPAQDIFGDEMIVDIVNIWEEYRFRLKYILPSSFEAHAKEFREIFVKRIEGFKDNPVLYRALLHLLETAEENKRIYTVGLLGSREAALLKDGCAAIETAFDVLNGKAVDERSLSLFLEYALNMGDFAAIAPFHKHKLLSLPAPHDLFYEFLLSFSPSVSENKDQQFSFYTPFLFSPTNGFGVVFYEEDLSFSVIFIETIPRFVPHKLRIDGRWLSLASLSDEDKARIVGQKVASAIKIPTDMLVVKMHTYYLGAYRRAHYSVATAEYQTQSRKASGICLT